MRMRLGVVVGFGAGYYLGAKAGTERYEELNRLLHQLRRSDAYETASDKAKAAVDLGVERVREAVDELKGSDGPPPAAGSTQGAGARAGEPPIGG